MKVRLIATAFAIVLGAAVSSAQTVVQPQPANADWIGEWQGQLEGQPAVVVTLAERDGHLDGTAIFHAVIRQPQPHVIVGEPHMLLDAAIHRDTLKFKINAFQGRPGLEYEMTRTGDGLAHLKCLNCDGTPEADLVRTPARARKS